MTEHKNPFLKENMKVGGGLWDGKNITITVSNTEVEWIKYKDGTSYIDTQTGKPAFINVWALAGIADDEENERKQTYSLGRFVPTKDGQSFVDPNTQEIGELSQSCEAAMLSNALEETGYDMSQLFDETSGLATVGRLVGATFTFQAVQKLTQSGKPKDNKNGYPDNRFFPTVFVGQTGVKGNGAVDSALFDFATSTVTDILKSNGGTLKRADLVKEISAKLRSDSRSAATVILVTKEEFFQGNIKRDGTSISLTA